MPSRYALNLSRIALPLIACGRIGAAVAQDEFQLNCARPSAGVVGERSECGDATITDGTTTISAGLLVMENLDVDQGEWRLSGGVSIRREEAELTADRAVVNRVNGEYQSFLLEGSPTRITLISNDNDETPVRFEADSIVYDVESGSLQLTGNVTFVFGENVFDTCALSYNIKDRSYTTPECGVRATVRQSESQNDSRNSQRDGP